MELSIVVCSYNRYALLRDCVSAIEKSSSFDPASMEIVVVENTPRAKRKKMNFGPLVRVVPCDEPGLSHARNAGIAAAKGQVVAFVDDDAVVHDDWCEAVVSAFKTFPNAEVCGGRTEPRYQDESRPAWFYPELAHYLSCIDWGPNSHALEPGQWIVGANMAFRRKVFDRIGYFDPALGRKGEGALLSNEEIAMLARVGRQHVYYIHNMVVDHIVPSERVSLAWFRKRVFWQAVSDVLSGELHRTPAQSAEELFEIVARAPAETRGHRLFSYEPASPDRLRDQLHATYLMAFLMSLGMPAASMKD